MTYAAEPYAQFVDDLLTALTGGAIRDEFRFLPEQRPFLLAADAPVIPNTVRVYGLVDGRYAQFRRDTDYEFVQTGASRSIAWKESPTGAPAKGAVWPDLGSTFFVNYDYQGVNPALTDRNVGSVTRLLAESFAREYAVVSRQMEAVYQAGFVETATGRDLEQLATLVGVTRRRRLSATGTVVFSRSTPAPADVFIPAGTRLATVEPPAALFETTEDRTLQRGNLSVEVPIAALVPGPSGIAGADTIRVINRPILGIDRLTNPQATRLGGSDETDEMLRARTRRSLEAAGGATVGSVLGALTTLPGLREKDVRVGEDYLARPGVVTLDVALPQEAAGLEAQAVALVEAARPVGVRVEYHIDAPRPLGPNTPGDGLGAEDTEEGDPVNSGAPDVPGDRFMEVNVDVVLTPTTLSLTTEERTQLVRSAEDAVRAFLNEAGIGETLVYNRLVAQLMALDGVLDVGVRIYPENDPGLPGRKNLSPQDASMKPAEGLIQVKIGGALIMLDVAVDFELKGAALAADPAVARLDALNDWAAKIKDQLATLTTGTLNVALLKNAVETPTYKVSDLHYHVEYAEAGVRIHQQDVALPLTGLERLWLRKVSLLSGGAP